MSLSDAPGAPLPRSSEHAQPLESERWGTVFMGPDATRESRMDKLLNQQQRELWNRGTEIEYLRRVREKAAAEAKSILDKARADGDELRREAGAWATELKVRTEESRARAKQEQSAAEALRLEAEQLRATAEAEGRQAGFEAARQEVLEHEARRDAAASAVLHRIQEQCGVMFVAWREELAALTLQAVQTGIGWIMSEEHARGLDQLLERAVQAVEHCQNFTIHVNPEDAELARELLGKAQDSLSLGRWTVLEDPHIEAGGLRLESDAGRVEDYPTLRRAVVEEALARLSLPPDRDGAILEAARASLPELARLPDPAVWGTMQDPVSEEEALMPPAPEEQASPPSTEELAIANEDVTSEADEALMPPDSPPDASGDFLPDVIPEVNRVDLAASVAELDNFEALSESVEPDEPRESGEASASEVQETEPLAAPDTPVDDTIQDAAFTLMEADSTVQVDGFVQLEGLDSFGDSGGLAGMKELKF